ncbi:MAG: hypothetical protein IKO80_10740 [Lachnospiraceae bacterium]|nr:hypothetical protein [Lachnospiraceae bacterium]
MSINRVDVQGTFIRQDASQIRQEEDSRAMADMNRLAGQSERRAEENHNSVTGTEGLEAQEQKYDASEEGKNKHLLNGRANGRKKKKEEEEDGLYPDPDGVIIGPNGKPLGGGRHSAFDLKI